MLRFPWVMVLAILFAIQNVQGQASCASEENFTALCVGSTVTYAAGTNVPETAHAANPGNDYGCLYTTPNPAWFYFKVDTTGNLNIDQSNSNNVDVDGAIWGPFDSVQDAVSSCDTYGTPLDCDYLAASTFSFSVPVEAGKIYVLLVTNYSNTTTNITLSDNASTASTNCNPDIKITKTVNNSEPYVTETVIWTITAENKGITEATNLVVTDLLPSGLMYQSHTGGTYSAATGDWTIGNLPIGDTVTLNIITQVDSNANAGHVTNTVSSVSLDQTEIGAATDDLEETILIKRRTVITNRRITYRVTN